jgi:hypothetical protein
VRPVVHINISAKDMNHGTPQARGINHFLPLPPLHGH